MCGFITMSRHFIEMSSSYWPILHWTHVCDLNTGIVCLDPHCTAGNHLPTCLDFDRAWFFKNLSARWLSGLDCLPGLSILCPVCFRLSYEPLTPLYSMLDKTSQIWTLNKAAFSWILFEFNQFLSIK